MAARTHSPNERTLLEKWDEMRKTNEEQRRNNPNPILPPNPNPKTDPNPNPNPSPNPNPNPNSNP